METIYKISNFAFQYPFSSEKISLNGEFEIKKNDIVLLNGISGVGKSTLLYALKGLIPNTILGNMTGEILFKGKDINALSTQERMKIGYVFQNPITQMVTTTVRLELALGLENLQMPPSEIKEKINEIAKKFHISHLLNRKISSLSGGEKQIVALLSVLITEPEIILFDEPTSFLDPESAKNFIEIFSKIAHKKTIVIIEHNLNYLKSFVNRFLYINEKRIIQEKQISEIKWDKIFYKIKQNQHSKKEILKIHNVSFSYKEKDILKKINFSIKQQEIVSILGKNGSGKSTLLKILSKLLASYNGDILFNDKELKKINPKDLYRQITLLLQNPELHFLFNHVEEEINNPNLLKKVNLRNKEKQNPFTLSIGEQRRLSLAISIERKKQFYLLDEPTFGLDEENINQFIQIIQELRNEGATFLIVSHDLDFVNAISDRILLLKDGFINDKK